MDVIGNKVPKYKLTDDQVNFQKQYAQLRKVAKLLEQKTLMLQSQSKSVAEAWLNLRKQFKMLSPPQEPTKEIPGMDFSLQLGDVKAPRPPAQPTKEIPAQQSMPSQEDMMIRY